VTPFGTDWNGCFGLDGKSFFKPEVDGLWLLVNFKALVCLAKVFKTCGYDGLFIEVKKETAPMSFVVSFVDCENNQDFLLDWPS